MTSRAKAIRCLATVAGTVLVVNSIMDAVKGRLTLAGAALMALYFALIVLAMYPLAERLARRRSGPAAETDSHQGREAPASQQSDPAQPR